MPIFWLVAIAGAYLLLAGDSKAAPKTTPPTGWPQPPPTGWPQPAPPALVSCSYYLVSAFGDRHLIMTLKQVDDAAALAVAHELAPSFLFGFLAPDLKLMRECSGQPPVDLGKI